MENLIEYYKVKKLAHAYLISTNNITKCMQVLLKVIKNIFCVNEYKDYCNKCSLCHLIDINNLPSLKIIEADGDKIKKNQIIELKNVYAKNSVYTKEAIYIIKNAHLMNKEAANTMLKFLEEPESNVIGFFITNQKNNIIPTIASRCQIIEANFDCNEFEKYNIDEIEYEKINNILVEYLNKVEFERKDLILYNRSYLFDLEKEEIIILFQMMLSKYKNVFEVYDIKNKNEPLLNYSKINLNKKIKLIIKILSEINYNVNLELLLDKFIIEMEEINNECL